MITIEQLKDVKERTAALERYLDIENKLVQVEEEQLRTQAPGFWDDAKKAEAQMRKVKDLQKWIDGYREVKTMADELELAFDFCKDDLVTEEEVDAAYQKAVTAVEALELKNMLRQEADQMDCVLKINCGAGGTESQDWASMLMRMYMRWAETNGYKVSVANLQDGDEAGIKTVTMNIEGSFAYGYLKGENGVHRLVRVSPYNAQGKRMTSFASVFVTPLVDDSIEVTIEPARMSWDTFRSGGAGGQNVNKVESGVRLRYQYKDPYTGEEEEILIENTETRDQPKNKENAMRQLRSILYDKELQHRMEEQAKVEAGKTYLYWGNYYMAVCELNDDMVSVKPNTTKILIDNDRHYSEAPYVFYRDGYYYFTWSKNDTRSADYEVRYVRSKSPVGPIDPSKSRVVVCKKPDQGIYATGHQSFLQVPGTDEWYIVYHRFKFPDGITMGREAGYHREVCMDRVFFNEDGTIKPVVPSL